MLLIQKTHSCHIYLYLCTGQTCLIQYGGRADVWRQKSGVHVNMPVFRPSRSWIVVFTSWPRMQHSNRAACIPHTASLCGHGNTFLNTGPLIQTNGTNKYCTCRYDNYFHVVFAVTEYNRPCGSSAFIFTHTYNTCWED